jgi:hypothetical protein
VLPDGVSLSQYFKVRNVQQLSAQEDMVNAMIANAGIRVRNDFFMVLKLLVRAASLDILFQLHVR